MTQMEEGSRGGGGGDTVHEVADHGHTAEDVFLEDLLKGLKADRPSIPTKYLYDDYGSELFDKICEVEAYYPTRTESAIFDESLSDIARHIGPRAFVIEPGAGNGTKAVRLLNALEEPVAVAVVDISMAYAQGSADILAEQLEGVEIMPVCADFTQDHDVPDPGRTPDRRVVFFPGSTVGNFTPDERRRLLRAFRRTAGDDGMLLIGFDLWKDRETLELAYDDPEGVTAAFIENVLTRANREVGTDFDRDAWQHRATWNPEKGRVELELVAQRDTGVTVDSQRFSFAKGEAIYVESSHKFRVEAFSAELATLGFATEEVWTDADRKFAVLLARSA